MTVQNKLKIIQATLTFVRCLNQLISVCCQEKLHIILQQAFYEVVLIRKTKPADVKACRGRTARKS